MNNELRKFYPMPLDQRLDTIALLLQKVSELTAWIEPDEKTEFVLEIIMQHIQAAQTLATLPNSQTGHLTQQAKR